MYHRKEVFETLELGHLQQAAREHEHLTYPQEVAHDTDKVYDTMETKKFVNESVAFLTASHIAHYYFTLGYHVNISAYSSCKEVGITIFTDDGLLPILPKGFSFSNTETRQLFDKEAGIFFSHRFTFAF